MPTKGNVEVRRTDQLETREGPSAFAPPFFLFQHLMALLAPRLSVGGMLSRKSDDVVPEPVFVTKMPTDGAER
jgi:hypothetical protein